MKKERISFKRSSTFRKYFMSICSSVLIVIVVLGLSLLLFIAQYWKENNVTVLKENVKTLSQTASEYFELDSNGVYINDPTVMLAYSLSLVSGSINSDIYICDLDGNVFLCKDIISSIRLEEASPHCQVHSKIKIPENIIKGAVKGNFQTSENIPELDEEASDDDLDLDFGFEEDFEDEEEAFDVNAFFNELNPTINDAGFAQGFVPDEDNM